MAYSFLLEDGYNLLLEDGYSLLLEYLVLPELIWLNVYDDSGNFVARIFEYVKIDECSIRSNTFGILKFLIHQDALGRDQLIKRYWIEVYRQTANSAATIWSGVICHVRKSFNADGDPTRFYEVMARSFEWLPYWRVVVPVSGQDYLVKSGAKVDDAVKYMVREQMVTGHADDADRVVSGFTVEADDTEHGDTKTLAARYENNLGDLLFKWASAYDFDWWVEADCPAATFVLRTKVPRRGADKSASVIFTVGRHNLVALEYYEDDLDTSSLVYVGGPGSGATQVVHTRPAAEPTGWDRRERYVPMANAEYSDELDAAGDAWLDSFGDVLVGVRFTLTANEAAKWPDDFGIGDVVTVYDADFSVDKAAEIKEVNLAVDEDGQETIELLVGEPSPSQWALLQGGLGQFSSFDNDSDPATPANPSDTVATVTDDRGNQTGSLRLNWNDNSELDLSGYQVEVLRTGEAKWKTQRVTASEAVFEGFPLGSSVTARVKARDNAGNESAYLSFGGAISMPSDSTAPSLTTNPPTVTAVKKGVHIKITRPTEQDWAYTEFYCDTNNPPTTLVKSSRSTVCTFKTGNYTLHYARYKLYDEAGNDSAYSNVGSATPEKVEGAGGDGDIGAGTVDTADITNLAVETAKINSLAVTTAKIDALAVTNAKINDLAAGKITAGSLDVTVLLEAASIKAGNLSVALVLAVGGSLSVAGQFTIDNNRITIIGTTSLQFGTVSPVYLKQHAAGSLAIVGSVHMGALFVDSAAATFGGDIYCPAANKIVESTGPYLRNIILDTTTGEAITVSGTTKVTNLNADLLDGYTTAETNIASTVVVRDNDGSINVQDVNKDGSSSAVVPTSQGKVRIIGIESPEVWFVDVVSGGIDPLFREICEGDFLYLPMYSAKKQTQPVKWLVFGKRRGYSDVRFEQFKEAVL